MKKTLTLLFTVPFFCGCQSKNAKVTSPAVVSVPAPLITSDVLDRPPATPAVYKRYYVGMSGSGNAVRSPGWMIVRERDETWNRNGGSGGTLMGPNGEYRDASYSPDPLPFEVKDAVARANDTINALKDENDRLAARLAVVSTQAMQAQVGDSVGGAPEQAIDPALNGSSGSDLPQAGSRVPVATPKPREDRSSLRSFKPNPDGLIEISPEFAYRPPGSPRVPFQQIYFPKVQIQEGKFIVSLVSPGPDPSAILNQKIVTPRDLLDGFAVDEITDEGLWLRRNYFRVWLPYAQQVTVRYPL